MSTKKLPFKEVNLSALQRISGVLDHWLPGGKREGKEYVTRNPTRSDKGAGSFSVNLNNGVWSDFATSDSGGDLISLVAYVDRIGQGEACKKLADFLGVEGQAVEELVPQKQPFKKPADHWEPVIPIPNHVLKTAPKNHYRNGVPSYVWEYKDVEANTLFFVYRFEAKNPGERKQFAPLSYCLDTNGVAAWRWQGLNDNRPLYGLDKLAVFEGIVVITEGEKAADAAQILLPDCLCMAWPNGAKSEHKVDFSPLVGREVWLWPDNDPQGKDCMGNVATVLEGIGARCISVIKLDHFKLMPGYAEDGSALLESGGSWEKGADAADALEVGWTASHIELIKSKGQLVQAVKSRSIPTAKNTKPVESKKGTKSVKGPFRCNDQGLFYCFDEDTPLQRICDRLDILAKTRDVDGNNWGLLVRFKDSDHQLKQWNIPADLLATEGGSEILRTLLNMGLRIEPDRKSKPRLLAYLQSYETAERARLVSLLGWHGTSYLLPEGAIGDAEEQLYFQSRGGILPPIGVRGSLDQWKDNISKYCIGNNRLAFGISVAFAGPLLWLANAQSGGFHFYGESSKGKSTLLKVVGSVYGGADFLKTWRSTDNALESIASAHSDGLLLLDEMKQCNGRVLGETIYMLGNGQGKARANERGTAKSKPAEWRLLFLSSGEKALSTYLNEAGMPCDAGMDIRLLGIPEDAAQGFGIFDDVHSFGGGAQFAQYLEQASKEHYGSAMKGYLEHLTNKKTFDSVVNWIREEMPKLVIQIAPAGASGQVSRAANRFALVALAGELATRWKLTGWASGEATKAATACFNDWLDARGGAGSQEDMVVLSQVRHFFEQHGESRFTRWDSLDAKVDEHSPRTINRCGYRQTVEHGGCYEGKHTETTYYVLPQSWKNEVCKGLDMKRVNKMLVDMGALKKDSQGKASIPTRLPGMTGRPRCYVVTSSLWDSIEDEQSDNKPEQKAA